MKTEPAPGALFTQILPPWSSKFLERYPGRGPDAGTRLHSESQRFLKRYRRFRQGLDGLVARHYEQSLRD